MRRRDRQQSEEFARNLIEVAPYGVLSMATLDGRPYAIPISHALAGNIIYVHSATEGTKLQRIATNPQVVFSCVGKIHTLPSEFSTEYESAIVHGIATLVSDENEKREALRAIAHKYSPNYKEEAEQYIERSGNHTTVIAIRIESITAKAKLPKKEVAHD
jgi:hypothetical protein